MMILWTYLIKNFDHDKNVEELVCENKQNKSKIQEKSTDGVLDNICQKFTLMEDFWNPFANAKLANVLEKFYLEKIFEEKTKSLLKKKTKSLKIVAKWEFLNVIQRSGIFIYLHLKAPHT